MIEVAVVNGSECYLSASFLDVNGNPYTPSSLSYRVDDLTNGVNVVSDTPVTPTGATAMITLSSNVNTMNAASAGTEERQVRLKVGVPGGSFRNDTIQYRLIRKTGTP